MARLTGIEYLTATWNPIAMRCTPVSRGCDHCWHQAMAKRFASMSQFSDEVRAAYAGEGPPVLVESRLEQPLHWTGHQVVGVQFMGDLFHEAVPEEFIWKVFAVMSMAQQHTFLVLTKRPERMCEVLGRGFHGEMWAERDELIERHVVPPSLGLRFTRNSQRVPHDMETTVDMLLEYQPEPEWPLPNAILGISAENQPTVDERVAELLRIPAAGRAVSLEPLLGPTDLISYIQLTDDNADLPHYEEHGWAYNSWSGGFWGTEDSCYAPQLGIHWVIVGGETGPGARPMHPDWVRSIRDQCQAAGVPFFFKSWGAWRPLQGSGARAPTPVGFWAEHPDPYANTLYTAPDGQTFIKGVCSSGEHMVRVGKKAAGNRLDGRAWEQLPEVADRCYRSPSRFSTSVTQRCASLPTGCASRLSGSTEGSNGYAQTPR